MKLWGYFQSCWLQIHSILFYFILSSSAIFSFLNLLPTDHFHPEEFTVIILKQFKLNIDKQTSVVLLANYSNFYCKGRSIFIVHHELCTLSQKIMLMQMDSI